MLIIGITGGIACGKTEVAKVFQDKGAIVLSGDEIVLSVRASYKGMALLIGEDWGE